ncbi:MAG TPA: chemotaxis response regulator protein-glutamate methylesterase [Steroidobacteraceae bacterium]|jgi:two-component system chemotaxis response regulator CheB|nr:chemotaxis response regulator protein-glutamate methylesterase [Steroidobacteraceae bacterium]
MAGEAGSKAPEAQPGRRVKVLIIDDSALVRSLLTRILGADRELEVIGTAPDAFVAREKIKLLQPDVLTLDVEMPRMDGLQFLRNLMRLRPMPVVMCSSLTERGADVTLAALELGAVDFVTKPRLDVAHLLESYAAELIGKVKSAATAHVRPFSGSSAPSSAAAALSPAARPRPADQIVAIGASTGGTEAIRQVLSRLPSDSPGVVITQHIPRAFTAQFAARMDACSAISVQEAQDGALIQPGCAYIAPGDRHLLVERDGAYCRCRLHDGNPVNRHRPSIDLLFASMAEHVGANAVGVILTGMGSDGARGLKQMRARGAFTIAQDEASSVVWGMPGAAVALGAVDRVLALEQIAAALAAGREAIGARRATGS